MADSQSPQPTTKLFFCRVACVVSIIPTGVGHFSHEAILAGKLSSAVSEVADLKEHLAKAERRAAESEGGEAEGLKLQVAGCIAELKAGKHETEGLRAEVSELKTALGRKEEAAAFAEADMARMRSGMAKLETQLGQKEDEVRRLEWSSMRFEVERKAAEVNQLELNRLAAQLKDQDTEHAVLAEETEELQRKVTHLEAEIAKQAKDHAIALKQNESKISKLQTEVRMLKMAMQGKSEQYAKLRVHLLSAGGISVSSEL